MTIFKCAGLVASIVMTMSFSWHTAWADEAAAPTENKSVETCFWLSQIEDFRSIDTRHVWVQGVGKDDQYLLTLFSSCTSLPFAETIALSTQPTERLCSNANEHLILLDQDVDNQSYVITTVEKVKSLEAARELTASRAKQEKKTSDVPE